MGAKPICWVLDRQHQLGADWLAGLSACGLEVVNTPHIPAGMAPPSVVLVASSGNDWKDTWLLLDRLRQRCPGTPVLLTCGPPASEWVVAAVRLQATACVPPPVAGHHLERVLRSVLPPEPCRQMVGNSEAIRQTLRSIQRAAPSDSNILLIGESGTGKELAAESIHRSSPRSNGPFICVNCAAIPDSLLESELFGHHKGAFTGAESAREGKFSEASGGTLFLDEIGDLSHYAQAKILRAIETRRIDRLGSRGGLPVDIRIVAASNRNLEDMVAAGLFRQDLYFRLNVVEIRLPPLRDRVEDISCLVDYYRLAFNHRFGQSVEGVAEEVLQALGRYAWPGNVRELRNLLEAIYVNLPPGVISLADLPESFRRRLVPAAQAGEKERLLVVLDSVNWNKSKAARRLSWSRVTLYRKLTRYHLSKPVARPATNALEPASEERPRSLNRAAGAR